MNDYYDFKKRPKLARRIMLLLAVAALTVGAVIVAMFILIPMVFRDAVLPALFFIALVGGAIFVFRRT